jgi:alkanesulfonate monooxygenase SsuD/methylene tetrahydromethanopterin reductase-like flavin-dependent oxidoreductase (luciferase family)
MTRERLDAMKAFWSEDEAEYHGTLVRVSRSWGWPATAQTVD